MIKSTLFIALQCCHCSTMQVKQQKKSSNKWNCVVCNQKQSVTKIYAQGYQAKEIRNIVQSFNMSRKTVDDNQLQQGKPSLRHFVENLESDQEKTAEKKAIRRTDWSEYMEDETNVNAVEPAYLKFKQNGEEMGVEPKVVTEFSEDLVFKKPKLMGIFGSSSVEWGKNLTYKPNFSKRGTGSSSLKVDDNDLIRDVRSSGQQQRDKVLTTKTTSDSKWSQHMAKDDFPGDIGRHFEKQQQQHQQLKKGGASKWSEYITQDGDGGDEGMKAAFADDLRLMRKLENHGVDHLVEEDIHPDFM